KVLEKIDALLDHPQVDPHGDPIPTAKGHVKEALRQSLADCELNKAMKIVRVIDQDAPFLQFVDRSGLVPGVSIVVRRRDALADSVVVQVGDKPVITLGSAAAAKILVE